MKPSASIIIALAQNTKALSKEQLARILDLAPEMSENDLEKLRQVLGKVKEAETEDLKHVQHALNIYKEVAARAEEWKADQARQKRQDEESKDTLISTEEADHLLHNLNK